MKKSIHSNAIRTSELDADANTIQLPVDANGNYPNNLNAKWSIVPTKKPVAIKIEFEDNFCTEKHTDKVRIYEGANGDGALVAILHGSRKHIEPLVVNASSAMISFHSDDSESCSGFKAHYAALYD